MAKQNAVQKFLVLLAFVVFPIAGYMTVSVVTPCAAAECYCGVDCVTDSLASAITTIYSSIIRPALNEARDQITAYFTVEANIFIKRVKPLFPWVTRQMFDWFDTFWYYNLLPSLQTMTDQLSVANLEQTYGLSSFIDANHLIGINRTLEDMAVADHRAQRPSDNVCVAGTVMSGMTRAATFARAYNAAAPAERSGRTANATESTLPPEPQTSSATGLMADLDNRWQTYTTRYCRKADNNEASGCGGDQPFADQDIDVAGMVFLKDTIDLKNPDIKRSIDDLVTNLAEPFVKEPVIAGADQSELGQSAILDGEAYRAKRQTIYDSLYHVISRRAPGSQANAFLSEIRAETGDPLRTGANPSRNEIMQAMMTERFQSGKYALRQIDEPENNRREMVIQQALQLMQMSDQLDLMDRYSLMLAAQVGAEIKVMKSLDTAAGSAPKR